METKFSIIIPVYNSEKYLKRCVDSILCQTYGSYEIILVDDGSTDSSPAICDGLAASDGRIRVIHKTNGGTSSARNAGLDASQGEYVTFMDNDDLWVGGNVLCDIAAELSESGADVLVHENEVFWQDTGKTVTPSLRLSRKDVVDKPPHEALRAIVASGMFSLFCVWSKVMKRSLLEEYKIRFPEGMRNEDTFFCGKLFTYARSYDYYERCFYKYVKGHAGAQTKAGIKYSHLSDLKRICVDFMEAVNSSDIESAQKDALLCYIAFPYCTWMGQSRMVKDKRVREDTKIMKKYSFVIEYDAHPSVRLIRKFKALFGYGLTCRALALYIKKTNHLS